MSQTLRFGLIGLGEIAYRSTGKILQQTRNAVAVAGMDPVPHIAQSYEETYHIPCTTDLDDILCNPDVDAVIISTPHNLHAPLGIQAAKAGKHVIVEKPMATSLADADALIAACREASVACSSKEGGIRYQPPTETARELINAGAIGDVMAVQIFGASNKPDSYWIGGYSGRVQTVWRKHLSEAGGGILIMNYIYDIYRIRYITSLEVTRVFAEFDTYRTPVEVEDFITATLRLSNGALGVITATSCAPGAGRSGMRGTQASGNRIYGTAGQIVFEEGNLLVYTDNEVEGLNQNDWTLLEFPSEALEYTWVTYFERFADAVFTGNAQDIPGEDGRADLAVALGIYEAGFRHAPVDLRV